MVHPEDRGLLNKAIQKAIEQNQHYDIEHRILLPDESIRWVLMTGAVIRNEKDTLTYNGKDGACFVMTFNEPV